MQGVQFLDTLKAWYRVHCIVGQQDSITKEKAEQFTLMYCVMTTEEQHNYLQELQSFIKNVEVIEAEEEEIIEDIDWDILLQDDWSEYRLSNKSLENLLA